MLVKQLFSPLEIKKDFPIFTSHIHPKKLIYLDNAATSQKPACMLRKLQEYYTQYNANIHRGIHKLSEIATEKYEETHEKVAKFVNASFEEIIFTKNTTESLNLLAYSLINDLNQGDEIVLTQMEHHSNIVPWQQIAKQKNLVIKFIKITAEGKLDLENAKELITDKTRIVSITQVSNVLGTINPVKEIAQIAHSNNALLILDSAQSVPHMPVDVKDLNCDFLTFSSHKMLGPTGIGVLYGKKHLLEKMQPFIYGGDMISQVSFKESSWNELPWKFEAGTPNIADAIAFGEAIDYLQKIGMKNIREHEKKITDYAIKKLLEIGAEIYGPLIVEERGGVVSFNIKGIHPHDLATILDRFGVAIRAGYHCAMPLNEVLGISGSARASFYIYNNEKDVDALIEAIQHAKKVFKV